MSGILFVVGTPIGNLGDLSNRAKEQIASCDFIAAEDTRVTIKLLNHLGIKKPLFSYFEHNKREHGELICNRIERGETCVLVSDAGMPAISDPGEDLVRECISRGIEVTVIPGPTALTAALAISGLSTGRFCFEGFLSMNKKRRKEHLVELKDETRTIVFYEAPHKLSATLQDLLEELGDRNIAIVRELTKIHEEVIRTTLSKAMERLEKGKIKGEIVLIVEGAKKEEVKGATMEEAEALAKQFLEKGMTLSEAAKQSAKMTHLKKGEIYKRILGEKI